jgi:hypothetical protein
VPVGYSNPNVPMAKPTQDWQGEHASYPLGVARDGGAMVTILVTTEDYLKYEITA